MNKNMTEQQLKKARKGFVALQLLCLSLALLFYVAFLFAPDVMFGSMGLTFFIAVGMFGFSMALYAQYRVLEAEVNFELRLREVLKVVKT